MAFLIRATILFLLITLVKNPKDPILIVLSVGLLLASAFENTAVDGLFNKNLRKEIRGSLNGAYNFFGNVGLLVFSGVGGYLYNGVGPRAPLAFVIFCDLAFAILCIVMRLLNKFN